MMALENQTKTTGTEKAQQNPDGSASPSRRRLIKGAFAAPMILTLHSGGAMAQSSNTPTAPKITNPDAEFITDDYSCITANTQDVGPVPCDGIKNNSSGFTETKCDAGSGLLFEYNIPENGTFKDCLGPEQAQGIPANAMIVTASSASSLNFSG